MADNQYEPAVQRGEEASHAAQTGEKKNVTMAEHEDAIQQESTDNLHKTAGIATIQQQHTIPTTGKRMTTGKWEYIFFCIFCTFVR